MSLKQMVHEVEAQQCQRMQRMHEALMHGEACPGCARTHDGEMVHHAFGCSVYAEDFGADAYEIHTEDTSQWPFRRRHYPNG